MTIVSAFVMAVFAAFALGAAIPAAAYIVSRIMLHRQRYSTSDLVAEIGLNLGLWFISVGCVCMTFALWRSYH